VWNCRKLSQREFKKEKEKEQDIGRTKRLKDNTRADSNRGREDDLHVSST
jgi:hypothetical protein